MVINIQDDILRLRATGLLEPLLADRTTGKNILWATNAYAELGQMFVCEEEIREKFITGDYIDVIQPRSLKAAAEQSERTRKRGEVSTPEFIIKSMCDHLDSEWFRRKSGFWKTDSEGHISFPNNRTWKQYADNRRMEITCGEGPFLTLRHSPESGELIPLPDRIGMLDRKLRAVSENASNEDEWLHWAYRALRATYGYEFQGDSLLLARINVLMTFSENLEAALHRVADASELSQAIDIITWNLWQMDGLTGRVPYRNAAGEQLSLFQEQHTKTDCRIYNWRRKRSVRYLSLKGDRASMKFDYIIGNPPYQEETVSDSTRKPPIYNLFMEEAYAIGEKVELITPARFLFNAGYTPKVWNEKMLNDDHFQVLYYEPDSYKVFSGVEIKGGVVISYRDATKSHEPIETFTKYKELNGILKKVKAATTQYIDHIISATLSFKLSPKMLQEHPNTVGRLRTSAFTNLSEIFYEECPHDGYDYVSMVGLLNGKRVRRYVRRDYLVDGSGTLDKYTLLVPNASGNGEFGEKLSDFEIAEPGVAFSQTFNAFGCCDSEREAKNIGQYIKTKFARSMLGVLKITQHLPAPKWKYVPLQDFTPASDINWSLSIPEIDQQLYAKYGLDETEIEFIETHVKEMV